MQIRIDILWKEYSKLLKKNWCNHLHTSLEHGGAGSFISLVGSVMDGFLLLAISDVSDVVENENTLGCERRKKKGGQKSVFLGAVAKVRSSLRNEER